MLTFTHTQTHSRAACSYVWTPRVPRAPGHSGGPLSLVCTLVRSWERERAGRLTAATLLTQDSLRGAEVRTKAEPSKLNSWSPNQPHWKLKEFTLSPSKNLTTTRI